MVCSAVFKSFLDEQGVDFNNLIMTPVEQVLISFGRNIADNPHEVFEDQIEEMKEFFTDEQLVVLTALAAMMVASNIVNTVLEVEI
jgi:alkylhydroperoxidase family enzyme